MPRPWHAPAFLAEDAFRQFCLPSKRRAPGFTKLAQRARFHLRHAVAERFGEIQIYSFEPSDRSKGTILLIHGWGAEASIMAAYAEPLRRTGFRVVAFDLPAHGRLEGKYTNLAACARAAHRVAEQAAPLHGVIAHSLEGLIALWLAEGGPPLPSKIPIGKIALLACPNRFVDVARNFGAGLRLCNALSAALNAASHAWDIGRSRAFRLKIFWGLSKTAFSWSTARTMMTSRIVTRRPLPRHAPRAHFLLASI